MDKIQAPVVRSLDNAIHLINRYPVDKCERNKPRYPLDFPTSLENGKSTIVDK